MQINRRILLRTALAGAVALAFADSAMAARLDPALAQKLPALAPTQGVEVIVSFEGKGPPTAAQLQALQALGLDGIRMQSLPIVGTVATPAQIQALLQRSDVRSVWFNAPLQYENREATALTGVDRTRTDAQLRRNGLPYSGKGIGVLVNDSGVDATHPDLQFGTHVVQNVAAQANLRNLTGIGPVTRLENMPNSDIGGGHGTHVAGIIGATGAASDPAGAFEGVAPGAGIIGYGSGAALFILDTVGGFDYALTHQFTYNIRVVSNSFGNRSDTGTDFDPDDPTNIATKALADRGVIVVFSAGNSGSGEATITGNFKKAPWVVTVGAGDKQGRLAGFSSRGEAGRGGEVVVDGETLTWVDRPTVTGPGVDIYSARASTADPTYHAGIDEEIAEIGENNALSYTKLSGTSMSAPHLSGVVAMMLEANPSMSWREVKRVLQDTATNIPGVEPWEAGAGYVNTLAAVRASLGAGGYGATVNQNRTFNANALLSVGSSKDYTLNFSPVGPTDTVQFEVGADVAVINARANVGTNTVAIRLTDPNGTSYGSSIALPVLGQNIAVSAPGVAGTWSMTIRGIGSVSGTAVDPLKVTNGYGLPGAVNVNVKQVTTDGYTGLGDVAGHPARGFIEYAVANRLVDGDANGRFYPDRKLSRGELAQYLVMGNAVRQALPYNAGPSFSDIGTSSALYPFAESVVATGAPLRNLGYRDAGVMGLVNGAFRPTDSVTRVSLAYSLVQGLGLQSEAQAFNGTLTVLAGDKRIPIEDAASIAAPLRGYVQLALDQGLINARFDVTQGPYDLQPTLRAWFDPNVAVTRAAFAAAASRTLGVYGP
ncbi:S8 family serine peptidase [Luteimonas vadosa]|uniref:SLH domain-containing protein n=1 Tax=Luteimonas vadosa TaxID=1165507 RepID=A0ABP9DMK0_9GAMM